MKKNNKITSRSATLSDAKLICDIYNYYIKNTTVTFEKEPLATHDMEKRLAAATSKHPWLVLEQSGTVLGYAYAGAWKSRCAYEHSVESTVYLQHGAAGHGFGSILYQKLIGLLKQNNVHAIIAGIALPNEASIALHEKFGFENIARFREVGYKFDRWIDVGYWELILR